VLDVRVRFLIWDLLNKNPNTEESFQKEIGIGMK